MHNKENDFSFKSQMLNNILLEHNNIRTFANTVNIKFII